MWSSRHHEYKFAACDSGRSQCFRTARRSRSFFARQSSALPRLAAMSSADGHSRAGARIRSRFELFCGTCAKDAGHNFRRLMEHDGGRLAFCELDDGAGVDGRLRTGQRDDSTRTIAVLTRTIPLSRELDWEKGPLEPTAEAPEDARFGRGASPAVGVRARRVPAGRSVPRDGGGADGLRAVGAAVARARWRGQGPSRTDDDDAATAWPSVGLAADARPCGDLQRTRYEVQVALSCTWRSSSGSDSVDGSYGGG